MAGPEGTAVEVGRPGISRRDALKRGAVAGGAVLWVSPIVQNIGISKAWATHTSPHLADIKDISFIAFLFDCGTTRYGVKLDFTGLTYTCGPLPGPTTSGNDCGVQNDGTESNGCLSPQHFTVTVVSENVVRVTLAAGCTFVQGQAFAKCGSEQSTTEVCVAATPIGNNTYEFIGCPQTKP